jgi:hypothetical protein
MARGRGSGQAAVSAGATDREQRFDPRTDLLLEPKRGPVWGRGRVKTCASQKRAALFSLLSFPDRARECFWFSD